MNITRTTAIWAITLLLSSNVSANYIEDNYTGGDDHGYGDVISSSSHYNTFNILGVDLSRSGTSLTVDIFTGFAGRGDDRLYHPYTETTYSTVNGVSQGIGYGDLFLSNDWSPVGEAPYINDDHDGFGDPNSSTIWQYGLALDNRWWDGVDSSGGTATLYELLGSTNNANALLTDDFMSRATYRNGQEAAVDTGSSTVQTVKDENQQDVTGTWSVEDGYLHMVFDVGNTSLLDTGEIALHWAMTCGNDTFEGSWGVPEPATLSLMGLSILGLGFAGRRKKMQ